MDQAGLGLRVGCVWGLRGPCGVCGVREVCIGRVWGVFGVCVGVCGVRAGHCGAWTREPGPAGLTAPLYSRHHVGQTR